MSENNHLRGIADPATVGNAAEFAVCLQDLRKRRGYSYAALDQAARALPPRSGRAQALPRSTVSDIVNGKSLPSREMLLTFLDVCHVNKHDIPQWLAAWERARVVGNTRPTNMVRLRAVNPRHLGVHAAVSVGEETEDLPAYVPRDIDAELHSRLHDGSERGLFVLLVGRPSAGKTRSAYEGALAALPDWWMLHPAEAGEVHSFAMAVIPRTIVWLDEIQNYLEDGLTAATMELLLQSDKPVIAIGTIWPDRYQQFSAQPQTGTKDQYSNERRLLKLAHVIDVDWRLSAEEYERALEVGETDPRIAMALGAADYPMTAVLTAGPELVRRWENAPDSFGEALITAAIDSMRLGAKAPLSVEVLRAAVPGYLSQVEQANAPADWFEVSLAYARETLRGAAAALVPVGTDMGVVAGYVVTDYLLEYGTHARRTAVPPDSFWKAHLAHGTDARDLLKLGEAAAHRALQMYAEPLYQSAVAAGAVMGWVRLAELRREQGRQDEAGAMWRQAAAAGYLGAWDALITPLDQGGRIDEAVAVCREALTAGYVKVRWHLAGLLERQGCMAEAEDLLRDEVAAGNLDARISLAELLEGLGRPEEAEQMWREEVAAETENARSGLAGFLRGQGRIDEAIVVLKDGINAGDDPYAWKWLADMYEQKGCVDEAAEARKEAIAMGEDWNAWSSLCWLLENNNRVDEAISFARQALEEGNFEAAEYLAGMLERQGQVDEALTVLKDVLAEGYPWVRRQLASLLMEQDQTEEAEQVLREGIALGEPYACSTLAHFLYDNGRLDEAIAAWWYALDYGDHPNTAFTFADMLLKTGRADEAERVWRQELAAGNSTARGWLAHLLKEQGRVNEASELRVNGLNLSSYHAT